MQRSEKKHHPTDAAYNGMEHYAESVGRQVGGACQSAVKRNCVDRSNQTTSALGDQFTAREHNRSTRHDSSVDLKMCLIATRPITLWSEC